jgi:hypothetical protein
MPSRYKKAEKVGRSYVAKQTKAARDASQRLKTVRPTKIVTMGKKIKPTSRTPHRLK